MQGATRALSGRGATMNELRPEIAPLADAVTNADRACALICMSDATMMTCEFTIRNRLRIAGFGAGLSYLDARLAVLRAPREVDGWPPEELLEVVRETWGVLQEIALSGGVAS